MITNDTIPFTIIQNNTYYCLSEDIGKSASNGVNFVNDIQNTTLDCLGNIIDSNEAGSIRGVYLNGADIYNVTARL